MKANRKFVNGEEAVSAVIGVILMVAITVAIAATVYVWVTGFGVQTSTPESASVSVKGENEQIRILLSQGGPNSPYTNTTGSTGFDVYINGSKVDHKEFSTIGSGASATWDPGESIILDGSVSLEDGGSVGVHSGVEYAVTVQILDAVVFDSTVLVTS
ncbi:MAG TPA: type IV pilin [Thermoplasmatales archaeon]|nr:type IV pilin [Thermoplasmatales archaeon]